MPLPFKRLPSMADHQRIHPEAPPTPGAPLGPPGDPGLDKPDPARQPPPCPPEIADSAKPPKKRRSCCCKCLCWTLFLLIIVIIVIGILAAIVYFVYRPKIPKYSIDSLRVTQFHLNSNMSLYAVLNVEITLRNPNKKIGIYYEHGSDIKGLYNGTQLCRGSLPKFYQGHRNTTVLDVPLTGQTQNSTDLLLSLRAQQQTGSIPLSLRAKVPVRIKLGSLKLPRWKFSVRCSLVVNSLSADNSISLRSSDCKFRFRL